MEGATVLLALMLLIFACSVARVLYDFPVEGSSSPVKVSAVAPSEGDLHC